MTERGPNAAEIREAAPDELDALRALWEGLYRHQVLHGMKVVVPDDGFAAWVRGLRPMLGRFAKVWVARVDGTPEGFVCARLRNQPPHFGGEATGFISDVYVTEATRGGGVGRRLVDSALAWFDNQGIQRVELQVIAGNSRARELYVRMGFQDELLQMVLKRRPASP